MATRKTIKAGPASFKFKGLKCVGNICFDPERGIVVKVPKTADRRCAKLITKHILGGRPVVFDIEGKAKTGKQVKKDYFDEAGSKEESEEEE